MTPLRLSRRDVESAMEDDAWTIGNDVLYQMCRRYPFHVADAEITAKVWLIGRAYSAAVERGRSGGDAANISNDQFYTRELPRTLRQSELDQRLAPLRHLRRVDAEQVAPVLRAHRLLVSLFEKLTGLSKRSLASKYLHFHCPGVFYIQDERSMRAIRKLVPREARSYPPSRFDPQYADFVAGALWLTAQLDDEFGLRFTPRQLDRLLLRVDL